MLHVEPTETVPLVLTVTREWEGGISGLSPTVAFRKALAPTQYLDWNDNTFKVAGWTTKNASMTDLGGGHYQRTLAMTAISAVAGDKFVAEYLLNEVNDKGAESDEIFVTAAVSVDLTLLRKMATNKLYEAAGNPGLLILYDDDGVTPLKTWQLKDGTGGGTTLTVGAPARREAAT